MTIEPQALVLGGTVCDTGLLGGKGSSLDQVIQLGIAVPPTGVITASAYREFVDEPHLAALISQIRDGAVITADEVDAAFLDVDFAAESAREILQLARPIGGDRTLAVRSSATVEDMAESSFAGQYRSLLGVDPTDETAVLDAVKLVFASLWHPAPCAYRRAMGVDDAAAAMCVVAMRMVPALRAGVVFTVDPGEQPGAARIEAVDGLGESLVSGERTPEAWVTARDGTDPDLPVEVSEALRIALVVERAAGTPQDVEWAWDGEKLWLLQARPITVTSDTDGDGFDSDPGDHDLTTAGIGEMLPGVIPPLLWQLNSHFVDEAFRRVLDDLGVLSDDMEKSHLVRRVRGRAALDFSRLHEMAAALPGDAADKLEAEYFGSRRPGRAAVENRTGATRLSGLGHDFRVLRARRRNALEGEIVIEAIRELAAEPQDLEPMTGPGLLAYRLGLVDLATRATAAELGVAADAAAAYRRIELLLVPYLGEVEAGRQAELVTRLGSSTVVPEQAASAALFGGPTWSDLDSDPTAAGRHVVEHPNALEELEIALTDAPSWPTGSLRSAIRIRALRHTVDEARTQLHRREQVKASFLRLGGEVRRVHLEFGRRLVEDSALQQPTDVELLTTGELHHALAGKPPTEAVIGRRRRWRIRYEAESPLPARFTGTPEPSVVELPPGGRLEGWAASGGQYTGRAQVIRSPKDPFDTGRILVAEATDASWSPLFVKAGAIVLERGGPLSHAAILARELGVPAVLNVPGVAHQLDDAELTIDGDNGIVVVHTSENVAVEP